MAKNQKAILEKLLAKHLSIQEISNLLDISQEELEKIITKQD